MKKPVLMIHEITEEMTNLQLEDYQFTFDDGLYSQYHYRKFFQQFKTMKTYFISTNIICNGEQSNNFLPCHLAHEQAFRGDRSQYMTLEQIRDLMNDPYTTIGGHSHFHKNLNLFSSLKEKVDHIKKDTELMLEWFQSNLNYTPAQFCFPYNDDLGGMYKGILEGYGFLTFHGRERTPIEMLLPGAPLPAYHDA